MYVSPPPPGWFWSTVLTTSTGFYLLGMWYKRSEAQKRFTFFFSSTTLAGAFGGVLASGLGKMEGIRGYNGWRWVFIFEGLLTCLVSFALFFMLPDFPEESKWLTDEEREFLRVKLAEDVGDAGHETALTWRGVLDVFKDCEFGSQQARELLSGF